MAVCKFADPCFQKKCKEVVGTVIFSKCPLSVTKSVRGVKEGEEGDCKQPFYHFGKHGRQVNASVIVRVVGGTFFVNGSDPVELPGSWPFRCRENGACKYGNGQGKGGSAIFKNMPGKEVGSGGFCDVDGGEKSSCPAGA